MTSALLDRRQPVRDHERRLAGEQPVEALEHEPLRFGVEAGARLVENQNPRVPHHRPRDAEPLPLSARQRQPALPDQRVVAVGQRLDELVRLRELRRAR